MKKVVLYNLPLESIKEENKVLGYKFSSRKGYEGIYIFRLGGKLYNPEKLHDGFNTLTNGEKLFFISNPGLGLWAYRANLG